MRVSRQLVLPSPWHSHRPGRNDLPSRHPFVTVLLVQPTHSLALSPTLFPGVGIVVEVLSKWRGRQCIPKGTKRQITSTSILLLPSENTYFASRIPAFNFQPESLRCTRTPSALAPASSGAVITFVDESGSGIAMGQSRGGVCHPHFTSTLLCTRQGGNTLAAPWSYIQAAAMLRGWSEESDNRRRQRRCSHSYQQRPSQKGQEESMEELMETYCLCNHLFFFILADFLGCWYCVSRIG